MRSGVLVDEPPGRPGDAGWLDEARLSDRTAPPEVRNTVYPGPRARNLTRLSVWPTFGSKESGSFPKACASPLLAAESRAATDIPGAWEGGFGRKAPPTRTS